MQNYRRFRELYSQQIGVIPVDTLQELESLSQGIETDDLTESDVLRDSISQLLTLEAIAAQGHTEILDFRPIIFDDNPQLVDNGLLNYYRWSALNWMRFNREHYTPHLNGVLEIELPSLQEVRQSLPRSEHEPMLQNVFDENVPLSDYVEELTNLVYEHLPYSEVCNDAYDLLGRTEPNIRNYDMPRLAFIPALTLAVVRSRYKCRFT
jgi:hypothetical protein